MFVVKYDCPHRPSDSQPFPLRHTGWMVFTHMLSPLPGEETPQIGRNFKEQQYEVLGSTFIHCEEDYKLIKTQYLTTGQRLMKWNMEFQLYSL